MFLVVNLNLYTQNHILPFVIPVLIVVGAIMMATHIFNLIHRVMDE